MAYQKVKFTSDSVKNTEMKINSNFSQVELDFDAKQDVIQYSTMPTASASNLGKIVQYVGITDGTYTSGYFYKSTESGGVYSWTVVATQSSSTVILNGTSTANASFYAPITGGTSGQVLKANGTNNAPTWDSLDASDVGALDDSTKYGASLSVSGTSVQLKDQDGNNLGSSITTQDTGATNIDESGAGNAYTGASYDASTRKITFTKGETFVRTSDIDSSLDSTSTNPVQNKVIAELIPAQASSSNQLADKNFVNSSIATSTATFRGTYNVVSDLSLTTSATEQQIASALASTISTADENDYCYVSFPRTDADPTVIVRYDRYKYNASTQLFAFEFSLNNSSFTAAQWAAINSGITDSLVAKLNGIEAGAQVNTVDSVNSKTGTVVLNADDISDSNTTNKFTTASEKSTWNAKQDAKTTYTFTASDAGWSAVDADGFYTLTITSAKTPFICFNSNGEQVLAGLKSDGTNIYVITDTKFAGSVQAF